MGKTVLRRLVGVGVAVVVALVVGIVWNAVQEKTDEANAPKVGDCLEMTGTPDAPQHRERECEDAKATFKVVASEGGCEPAPLELNYVIARGSEEDDTIADVCLDLNATEGDCFVDGGTTRFTSKAVCGDVKGNGDAFRVVRAGKPGDQCATGTQPRANEKRGTLLCLGPA